VAAPNLASRVRVAIWERVGHLLHEVAKFGVVGGVAFVVDAVTFNLLLHYGGRNALLYDKVTTAKTVSIVLATLVSYTGNRFWTYRHRERSGYSREYLLFFAFNGVGLLITLACLDFSHYVLGFKTGIADNISGVLIGTGLATMFRFWAYRRYVFPSYPEDDELNAELRQPV
jgi:putative flippase GtrA